MASSHSKYSTAETTPIHRSLATSLLPLDEVAFAGELKLALERYIEHCQEKCQEREKRYVDKNEEKDKEHCEIEEAASEYLLYQEAWQGYAALSPDAAFAAERETDKLAAIRQGRYAQDAGQVDLGGAWQTWSGSDWAWPGIDWQSWHGGSGWCYPLVEPYQSERREVPQEKDACEAAEPTLDLGDFEAWPALSAVKSKKR